jgi:signal transduction histidine kinase
MKHRHAMQVAVVLAAALTTAAFAAGDRATAKEAEAMVKKGVAYIKANPRDKAMADISNKQGQFVDRDLYLTVYKLDGMNLAHGANEKFIGKNMIDLKDIDGKDYIRERLNMAKGKSAFWQDFKFVNPVNKKIEPKQMYCERADELVVCGGIYKPA